MTTPPPSPDPFGFLRDALGQWEKLANEYGSKIVASPDFARTLHKTGAVGLQAQAASHEGMAKLLSLANLPSRTDLEVIAERLAAVEASLSRIEAAIVPPGAAPTAPARPKPARTRRPPSP